MLVVGHIVIIENSNKMQRIVVLVMLVGMGFLSVWGESVVRKITFEAGVDKGRVKWLNGKAEDDVVEKEGVRIVTRWAALGNGKYYTFYALPTQSFAEKTKNKIFLSSGKLVGVTFYTESVKYGPTHLKFRRGSQKLQLTEHGQVGRWYGKENKLYFGADAQVRCWKIVVEVKDGKEDGGSEGAEAERWTVAQMFEDAGGVKERVRLVLHEAQVVARVEDVQGEVCYVREGERAFAYRGDLEGEKGDVLNGEVLVSAERRMGVWEVRDVEGETNDERLSIRQGDEAVKPREVSAEALGRGEYGGDWVKLSGVEYVYNKRGGTHYMVEGDDRVRLESVDFPFERLKEGQRYDVVGVYVKRKNDKAVLLPMGVWHDGVSVGIEAVKEERRGGRQYDMWGRMWKNERGAGIVVEDGVKRWRRQ